MRTMLKFFRSLRRDEEGATAVEYAVMLAVILGVTGTVLTDAGTNITTVWTNVNTMLGG